MNSKEKLDINAVKLMRDIRDKISKEIAEMSFEEIQAYFKKRKQRQEANTVVHTKKASA
jgi:hypothetical protein